MYRGVDDSATPGPTRAPINLVAVGKIQRAVGSITIARANLIIDHLIAGDLVYQGDLIETGADGLVEILFVDGTTFHLYASTSLALDEFTYGAEPSTNSVLLRVVKGLFGFFAGRVAATGRFVVDTPLTKIQNAPSATGVWSLAFVFVLCLIRDLHAESEEISLVDDGTVTPKISITALSRSPPMA